MSISNPPDQLPDGCVYYLNLCKDYSLGSPLLSHYIRLYSRTNLIYRLAQSFRRTKTSMAHCNCSCSRCLRSSQNNLLRLQNTPSAIAQTRREIDSNHNPEVIVWYRLLCMLLLSNPTKYHYVSRSLFIYISHMRRNESKWPRLRSGDTNDQNLDSWGVQISCYSASRLGVLQLPNPIFRSYNCGLIYRCIDTNTYITYYKFKDTIMTRTGTKQWYS